MGTTSQNASSSRASNMARSRSLPVRPRDSRGLGRAKRGQWALPRGLFSTRKPVLSGQRV